MSNTRIYGTDTASIAGQTNGPKRHGHTHVFFPGNRRTGRPKISPTQFRDKLFIGELLFSHIVYLGCVNRHVCGSACARARDSVSVTFCKPNRCRSGLRLDLVSVRVIFDATASFMRFIEDVHYGGAAVASIVKTQP